jgi:transcriptional regulator with XRE-family HTH domain
VGIGEALAQARHQAGLTVAEISQRTRIREALIRDIENNDYSACGGDFYARGHIRAIAKATGDAAEPLIREALTLADIFHDTPATLIMPGTAATTRGRHRPNKTQALAVLAAFLVALGFVAYGLLSGSRHAATAAPRARGQPTAQHDLNPNQRADAAVPAPPPAQRRARTPISTAAAGPYDGQRSKSQAHAAGDRPRSHRSQISQLVDQRPLREPGPAHLRAPGLRSPAGHTRADRPRQRFRRGDPGARRPGGPTAYRPHGPRGRRGAAAAHPTNR